VDKIPERVCNVAFSCTNFIGDNCSSGIELYELCTRGGDDRS
jgi:hypothetical protein